jgi:ASC-1-like (ASCH) protein
MHIKKSIQLTKNSLEVLIKNKYSLDFRLNQDTWKEICKGDFLEFWEDFSGYDKNPSKNSRRVIVEVLDIFISDCFLNLIDDVSNLDYIISEDNSELLRNLNKWWTTDKELFFGVKCFYIKVI